MKDEQVWRDALDQLADLWRRERAAAKARFREERELTPFPERVRKGNALDGLSLGDMEPAPGDMTLLWLEPRRPEDLEGLRLGPGDPVVIWREDPQGADAVRGTIARRRTAKLGVMVAGDDGDELEADGLRLDAEEHEATFDRGDRAIAAFRDAPLRSPTGRLRGVLLGGEDPASAALPELEVLDSDLNAPQVTAVRAALAAESVSLIHGPPGTGKTRTLVEVVRQAVASGQRVLATAASNAAVDNLAERLAATEVGVVRIGHPARVSPAVEPHLLSSLVQRSQQAQMARAWTQDARRQRMRIERKWAKRRISYHERREALREVRQLLREAREQLRRAKDQVLQAAQVVCATAAGADADLLGDERFDLVVVDEATQATDPIALVALRRADRTVLAGDPCQLPPTVVDPRAAREGLATTLFERLAARSAVSLLTVQHRMHATLMGFPSESMYEGRLVAAESVAAHLLEDLDEVVPDPERAGPLVFLDTAGKGWEEERSGDDPSTSNPGQAERTAREVRRLLSRGLDPADVGVITPYGAQVRLLRDLLRPETAEGLEVHSVDGFQGREKEAIVVDLVRCNDRSQLGFLEDTRRMNVALTRARRFLLVLGDSATLGGHSYYQGFLQGADAAGGYLSAWSDEAEPLG